MTKLIWMAIPAEASPSWLTLNKLHVSWKEEGRVGPIAQSDEWGDIWKALWLARHEHNASPDTILYSCVLIALIAMTGVSLLKLRDETSNFWQWMLYSVVCKSRLTIRKCIYTALGFSVWTSAGNRKLHAGAFSLLDVDLIKFIHSMKTTRLNLHRRDILYNTQLNSPPTILHLPVLSFYLLFAFIAWVVELYVSDHLSAWPTHLTKAP